jgi:transposase
MAVAVQVTRTDHTAAELRAAARKTADGAQVRRLLAVALILEGHARATAAERSGMDRQTLRDWVYRYNDAGLAGLASIRSGRPAALLTAEEMAEMKELTIKGPDPEKGKVVRWRCIDLREVVTRRVVMEVTGADGAVRAHEIGGGAAVDEYSPRTVGLTLAEGKLVLAGLQHHLVQAQTEDHCRRRRRCQRRGAPRPIKDKRSRRLLSLFGTVNVSAPRFEPCRCAVTRRQTLSPVSEIMPDRCTPEYERVVARMGASLPYCRARTLLSEFLPLEDSPSVETARQRTIRVGARLETAAVTSAKAAEPTSVETKSIALAIDGGHVRSARQYQGRSFEVLLAQVTNDDGKRIVFSSVPAEAISQQDQLRGVLYKLGATAVTAVTILSDGAGGPRALGEAASPGPTHHVLDWFHLSMRVQHVDQAAKSSPDVSEDDRQTVRISLRSSIGFAGVCGMARSLGPSISLAKRWSRWTVSPTARSCPPWPRERWRICCAISRHIFVDNPISSSITPRRGTRTSRFRWRTRKVRCSGCCTDE